jgi:hypothetical protein
MEGRPHSFPVFVAVGVTALLLTFQLFVPPIVGLANNGDFERVMVHAGLQYRAHDFGDKYYAYVVRRFDVLPSGWSGGGYRTSEALLVLVARAISRAASGGNLFDIRALGALNVALLLAALGLLVAACRDLARSAQWVVAALLALAFTDVGYAAPLNSFYSQSASLVFLLLTIAVGSLAIRRGRLEGGLLPAYVVCALLFIGSKPQEAIQGPLLAFVALRLAGVSGNGWWRRGAAWPALVLCAFSLWYYRETPRGEIHNVGLFHSVFLELLPHSPDPARDLAEMGLEADLLAYARMSAYQPGSPINEPAFRVRFFDRFGYAALVRFYLAHPARLLDRLRRGAPSAFRLRPWRLGNYDRDAGFPPNAMTRHFAIWSDLRLRFAPYAAAWLTLFFVANAAACLAGYRSASPRGRLVRVGIGVLLVMAGLEYVVCALADYLGDLGRHLYVFQALCDLVLIADAAWLVQRIATRPRRSPAALSAAA